MAEDIQFSERLRGLGPIGVATVLIVVGANMALAPLGAVLAILWKWLAEVPWAEIGFRRPRSWVVTLIAGAVGGIFFKLLMKALVMPLLGAPPVNAAFHFIAGNPGQMISMVFAVIIVGGFGEEIVYRGFLFERLGRALGHGKGATIAIVVMTSLLFASIHIREQGIAGAEQAFITGLTFGTLYLLTRSLWLPIVMHASLDVTAVLIIYWGLEAWIAHLLVG